MGIRLLWVGNLPPATKPTSVTSGGLSRMKTKALWIPGITVPFHGNEWVCSSSQWINTELKHCFIQVDAQIYYLLGRSYPHLHSATLVQPRFNCRALTTLLSSLLHWISSNTKNHIPYATATLSLRSSAAWGRMASVPPACLPQSKAEVCTPKKSSNVRWF